MEFHAAHQTFVAEGRELIAAMEEALLRLESDHDDVDAMNAVFRAAHTIKGSSGAFGHEGIVAFTHAMESLLEELRAGHLSVDAELIGVLLACGDHVSGLLDAIVAERPPAPELQEAGRELLSRLHGYIPGGEPPDAAAAEDAHSAADMTARTRHIAVRFAKDVMRHGMDPLAIVRYLGTLGRLSNVKPDFEAMPDAQSMDAESCYLSLEMDLTGVADQATIEQAFEFVREDCVLRVTDAAPAREEAAGRQTQARDVATHESSFVRVRADKLDELITLVGELVIAGAGTRLIALRSKNADLVESTSTMERLAQDVRDGALKLRMIPIAETFSRFKRVVRDLGQELGKDVELVLTGIETEVDKSMADRIADPLMHLVRNALDHGLEDPATRSQCGKPAQGRLFLNAYHDSGNIVIEVADDGRGLDRNRILERAVERGLLAAGQAVTDGDLLRLVLEPGFSTADAVTSVSGRGIGMDVVKRNVEALRGTLSMASTAGEGTTVSIRLPLTLAIIDGFVVGVGRASYVIPLDMVLECVELAAADRAALRERSFMNLRDEVLPLIRLRDVFGIAGAASKRENVVVVQSGGRRAGFVVDSLQGEFQTVIKPLGRLFERLSGISGSTILGNGEVGLILDVHALVQRAEEADAAKTRSAMGTMRSARDAQAAPQGRTKSERMGEDE